ncbi:MAG: peptidylprolyl isomerase [Clostridia bacterium]|nr:peptidylprolyl isomerase [Clostridia bacterium]
MADRILATVGNITVTEKDLAELMRGLGQRGQAYNSPEGRRALLNQVINNKLLLLDARRNLYEAEPAFRDELNRLKENLLISYAGEKAIASVTVTDAEAKEYYEDNKAEFTSGESVNASHILVDTEDEAKKIHEEITSGKISFEDAARAYSKCPSKDAGGNLGSFERGQMVSEFDSAVFAMSVGELTKEPVKTQFGYHLILLNSKEEAKLYSYSEIADQIKAGLLNEKRRKAYESKINQLKIMYPVDLAGI